MKKLDFPHARIARLSFHPLSYNNVVVHPCASNDLLHEGSARPHHNGIPRSSKPKGEDASHYLRRYNLLDYSLIGTHSIT